MDFTSIPERTSYMLPTLVLLTTAIFLSFYLVTVFERVKVKIRLIVILMIAITLPAGLLLGSKDNYREIQEIAKNNIDQKYDTSNIKDIDYCITKEEATGVYTNWDTSSKEKLTFIFNDEGEPKLVTSTSETEYLKTIEKEISRN